MALITLAELKEHVESDLSDAALQRLLDSEDAEIVKRTGAHSGAITETLNGRELLLFLGRPAAAVTSVTEYVSGGAITGETATVLAANDYRIWGSGRYLQRLPTGTNPRTFWGSRAQVVYTPRDESAERTLVLINLCRLAVEYRGLRTERVGDYSMTSEEYTAERERLLSQLEPSGGVLLV
jgi:hypothetical protein